MTQIHELRRRFCKHGLVLGENGDMWVVTDNAPGARGIWHEFKTLEMVETWLLMLEGK